MDMNIKGVEKELVERFKLAALGQHVTLRAWVVNVLSREVGNESQRNGVVSERNGENSSGARASGRTGHDKAHGRLRSNVRSKNTDRSGTVRAGANGDGAMSEHISDSKKESGVLKACDRCEAPCVGWGPNQRHCTKCGSNWPL